MKLPKIVYAYQYIDFSPKGVVGEPTIVAEKSLEACAPKDNAIRMVGVYELKETKRIKRAVEIVA